MRLRRRHEAGLVWTDAPRRPFANLPVQCNDVLAFCRPTDQNRPREPQPHVQGSRQPASPCSLLEPCMHALDPFVGSSHDDDDDRARVFYSRLHRRGSGPRPRARATPLHACMTHVRAARNKRAPTRHAAPAESERRRRPWARDVARGVDRAPHETPAGSYVDS